MRVIFNNIGDGVLFVQKCNKYDEDIDVIVGNQIWDAKSINAIINLIGNRYITIKIHTDDEKIKEQFKKSMSLWKVEEE